ncbi:CDGSH iron-sulfur domain-containing protein [Streptomyces sp. NPDC002817]
MAPPRTRAALEHRFLTAEPEDGTTVSSDRFRVARCTCRRSRRCPWCDTSHRERS